MYPSGLLINPRFSSLLNSSLFDRSKTVDSRHYNISKTIPSLSNIITKQDREFQSLDNRHATKLSLL